MLRIAICDDNREFLEYSKNMINMIETDDIKRIDCFDSPEEFSAILKTTHYNIIFLDISMPIINGFEIANELNNKTEKSILIFVTSHEQLALKGYNYNAFRFIRKKDFGSEIEKVINDAIEKIAEWHSIIHLKYKSKYYTLLLNDIYYIISFNNYITIKYKDNTLKFRVSLSQIKNKFLRNSFANVNRGIIVNCIHIVNIDINDMMVFLDNGEFIKVSKTVIENIKKKLMEYE